MATRKKRKRTSTRRSSRTLAAFGLGGNLGAPDAVEAALARAVRALADALGPVAVAPLYRSVPRSDLHLAPQPPFLNTVVLAETDREPEDLLALAKALERAAGRRRPPQGPRHGPRPLDVDLLLWGDRVSAAPELTLPHPGLAARRFVLAPLADLAPGLRVPPAGETVAALLARVGQEGEVERIGWSGPPPAPARYPPPPDSSTV